MATPATRRAVALDHFVLRVRNLDRSLSFYRDTLGLPVEFLDEYRAGTRPFVSVRIGAQLLDLVPDPNYDPQAAFPSTGFLHFCVRIDGQLSDWIPLLRERGIELIDETPASRMGATGQGLSIYVRDPDEYIVELKEDRNA